MALSVNGSRAIILLMAFGLTLLGSSRLVLGQTVSQELPPLSANEFCAPPARAEMDCPKTGAVRCACYLQGKRVGESTGEAPALPRPIVAAKAPRKGNRVNLLPENVPVVLKASLAQAPPPPLLVVRKTNINTVGPGFAMSPPRGALAWPLPQSF